MVIIKKIPYIFLKNDDNVITRIKLEYIIMKRIIFITILLTAVSAIFAVPGNTRFSSNIFKELKIDVPAGFMYGKIPSAFKKWFPGNPWEMNRRTIRKIANKMYPGGNYRTIGHVHMTIIANKQRPYNDDIVCYMIIFKNKRIAKKELKKLTDYAGYNSDRAIVVVKDNMAVFLHVDDTLNFKYISDMATKIKARLASKL